MMWAKGLKQVRPQIKLGCMTIKRGELLQTKLWGALMACSIHI